MTTEQARWQFILGSDPSFDQELDASMQSMADCLDVLYHSDRRGSLHSSQPTVSKWLGDVRKLFPPSAIELIQKDAIDRLGVEKLLGDPAIIRTLQPDVQLAATLLNLSNSLKPKALDAAREVISHIVKQIEAKIRPNLLQTLLGQREASRRLKSPKLSDIDWHRTIKQNLGTYLPESQTIVPTKLYGRPRRSRQSRKIVILIDQSGSMAESVIFTTIYASAIAQLPGNDVRLIAFDTSIVDLTAHVEDPVQALFAAQLGGGTDIAPALQFVDSLIDDPTKTTLILISDLFDGGNRALTEKIAHQIVERGVNFSILLALSESGTPEFDRALAYRLAEFGIPSCGLTPDQFPDWFMTLTYNQSSS